MGKFFLSLVDLGRVAIQVEGVGDRMKQWRFSPSGIEYLTHIWTPYSGCRHKQTGICVVPHCWAEAITKRFPGHYPNGFEPTFYPEAFQSPLYLKKPARIGVCFMGDLFGDWVNPEERFITEKGIGSLKEIILDVVDSSPQHTFLFLTKAPWNLLKWSPFPDNAWVGVSVWDQNSIENALGHLSLIEAKTKFLSIEPLLGPPGANTWEGVLQQHGIKWLIIGSQTSPKKLPEWAWVKDIIVAADKAGIPVWEKNNLKPLLGNNLIRQELPE